MDLISKPITMIGKDKKRVKEMYMSAFEKEDQMPFWLMQIMSWLWHTEFFKMYFTFLVLSYVETNNSALIILCIRLCVALVFTP